MTFNAIDPELSEPVHTQVANQIEAAIESGDLPCGALLPTVRQLARDLHIAPNTVVRAYAKLRENRWILSDGRRGTKVLYLRSEDPSDRLDKLRAAVNRLVETLTYRHYSCDEIRDALRSAAKSLSHVRVGHR